MGSCSMEQGCAEAQESPWTQEETTVNTIMMALPPTVASLALLKHKPRKFIVYQLLAGAFVTAWRKLICARCQYYGKPCSVWMGVLTSKLMPKDEEKELDRNAMIADFIFIGLLVLYPLPQVLKSLKLTCLYLLTVILTVGTMLTRGCAKCGNDFCPLKDVYRSYIAG